MSEDLEKRTMDGGWTSYYSPEPSSFRQYENWYLFISGNYPVRAKIKERKSGRFALYLVTRTEAGTLRLEVTPSFKTREQAAGAARGAIATLRRAAKAADASRASKKR